MLSDTRLLTELRTECGARFSHPHTADSDSTAISSVTSSALIDTADTRHIARNGWRSATDLHRGWSGYLLYSKTPWQSINYCIDLVTL